MNDEQRKEGVLKSKFKLELSKMPRLKHWPDRTKPFRSTESEVCRWLAEQEAALNVLFGKAQSTGMIVFDPETGTWRGCDSD